MKHRWNTGVVTTGVLAATLIAVGSGACRKEPQKEATTPQANGGTPAAPQTAAGDYPEPRFPSYLKPPGSIDEVMPFVRPLVRTRTGLQGAGLGIIEKGETVLFVVSTDAEDMIVNAVVKGMEERGAKVVVKRDYEIAGIPKEEAIEYRKSRRTYTSEQGYMEAANWVDANFPKPDEAKAWLKQRRPDLYDKIFPANRQMSPRQRELYEKMRGESIGNGIREFLEKNPQIRGAYWGKGGSTSLRRRRWASPSSSSEFSVPSNGRSDQLATPESTSSGPRA